MAQVTIEIELHDGTSHRFAENPPPGIVKQGDYAGIIEAVQQLDRLYDEARTLLVQRLNPNLRDEVTIRGNTYG